MSLSSCKVVAKDVAAHGVRASHLSRLCAHAAGREADSKTGPGPRRRRSGVINKVMLEKTVDSEFTTVDEVSRTALLLGSFLRNALTEQRSS